MKITVYILGLGYIVFSSCLILYTRPTVDAVKTLLQKYPLRYLSAIPALVGFLFLITAAAIQFPWVFRVLGLLGLIEALAAFTDPQKIYSRILAWYFEKVSDQMQRLFGILGVILGTAILGWIK